ncbi:hypothetical protein ABEB36_009391 [Hypothenemus hampei]|uniref:Uncharacterized protein n=1 Tax=Hypothenemus hampei TaxID=57062 RepID=A0ABD1EGP8_HYPHA
MGASETLLKELAAEYIQGYKNHLRMAEEKFEERKVHPKIQKKDTVMRKALSSAIKLQITLRYLATGDSFNCLAFTYRVTKNKFIHSSTSSNKFEVLVGIDKVDIIVKTAYALHNWLRTTASQNYTPIGSLDKEDLNGGSLLAGSWRTTFSPSQIALRKLEYNIGSNNYTTEAANKRDRYADYFLGPGAISWQENIIYS